MRGYVRIVDILKNVHIVILHFRIMRIRVNFFSVISAIQKCPIMWNVLIVMGINLSVLVLGLNRWNRRSKIGLILPALFS